MAVLDDVEEVSDGALLYDDGVDGHGLEYHSIDETPSLGVCETGEDEVVGERVIDELDGCVGLFVYGSGEFIREDYRVGEHVLAPSFRIALFHFQMHANLGIVG